MKLHNKHRHNPQKRLRACLLAEKRKSPDMILWTGEPNPRVKEILLSAEQFLTRKEIYAILAECLE